MNISSTEIIRERFRVADGTLFSRIFHLTFPLFFFFFFASSISSRLLSRMRKMAGTFRHYRSGKKKERKREKKREMYKREAEY